MNNVKVTHISYQTAKALIEFCPELPEPMEHSYISPEGVVYITIAPSSSDRPCYYLHDLLSKPFCEAFVTAGKLKQGISEDLAETTLQDWPEVIGKIYFDDGLPAVEACLMKMIGGK